MKKASQNAYVSQITSKIRGLIGIGNLEHITPKFELLSRLTGCKMRDLRMADLPPEMILLIFSRFSVKELCVNIAPVCRTWYQLSKHPSLWKDLSFTGTSASTDEVRSILQQYPRLEKIKLVGRNDVSEILAQISQSNKEVKTLVIKRCKSSEHMDIVSADLLINLIEQCSQIVNLTIQDTPFHGARLCQVLHTLLPLLGKLNLSYDVQIGRMARIRTMGFYEPLEQLHCFRFLPITYQSILSPYYDRNIQILCSNMKTSITVLKLTVGVLTDISIEGIATCSKLQTLHLRYALSITRNGIMKLTQLKDLNSLYISGACAIQATTWCDLFNESQWNGLTKLGLVICPMVNNDVTICISRKFDQLEKLRLCGCFTVNDKGLSHIIRKCNKLKYLNVFITGEFIARSFPLIPDYIPGLKKLVYRPCGNKEEQLILHSLKNKVQDLELKTTDD